MNQDEIPIITVPDPRRVHCMLQCQHATCQQYAAAEITWILPRTNSLPRSAQRLTLCELHLDQYRTATLTVQRLELPPDP